MYAYVHARTFKLKTNALIFFLYTQLFRSKKSLDYIRHLGIIYTKIKTEELLYFIILTTHPKFPLVAAGTNSLSTHAEVLLSWNSERLDSAAHYDKRVSERES